jgi:hypothetical protein
MKRFIMSNLNVESQNELDHKTTPPVVKIHA